MPFISEEIWQYIQPRSTEEALCISSWPTTFEIPHTNLDPSLFESLQQFISAIRNVRAEMNISPKKELSISIKAENEDLAKALASNLWVIQKIEAVKVEAVSIDATPLNQSTSVLINTSELFISLEGMIDLDKEKEKLHQELERLKGFLRGIQAKLNNQKFVENAPDHVVQNERNKESDTLQKLSSLEEQLQQLER